MVCFSVFLNIAESFPIFLLFLQTYFKYVQLQRRSNKIEELSKPFRYSDDVAVSYWLYDLPLFAGHKNLP